MADLLKVKIAMKKRQPSFKRQDSNQKDQFHGWKKPRGMHNKMRRRMRGHMHVPNIGFGSPTAIKFVNRHGLIPVLITNLTELKRLDNKKNSIILGKLGLKKKIELIKKCVELKFSISNLKDPSKFLEEKNKFLMDKKKLKQDRVLKKEKSKSELEKKAKEKETKEDNKEKKTTTDQIKEDMKKSLPGDKK